MVSPSTHVASQASSVAHPTLAIPFTQWGQPERSAFAAIAQGFPNLRQLVDFLITLPLTGFYLVPLFLTIASISLTVLVVASAAKDAARREAKARKAAPTSPKSNNKESRPLHQRIGFVTAALTVVGLAMYVAAFYALAFAHIVSTARGLNTMVSIGCAYFCGASHVILGVQAGYNVVQSNKLSS